MTKQTALSELLSPSPESRGSECHSTASSREWGTCPPPGPPLPSQAAHSRSCVPAVLAHDGAQLAAQMRGQQTQRYRNFCNSESPVPTNLPCSFQQSSQVPIRRPRFPGCCSSSCSMQGAQPSSQAPGLSPTAHTRVLLEEPIPSSCPWGSPGHVSF